jgi:hypothetical protein
MPSPNRLVQIVMNLNSLPKRIFPLAIANARILGVRQQSRCHKEENLPFHGVFDGVGKNSKSGDPRAVAKTSATITSPFPTALDPSFANWLQKDRYCADGGRNNGLIGDALSSVVAGSSRPLKWTLFADCL